MGYTASQHLEAISRHAGGDLLDCAVVNTRPMRKKLLDYYARTEVYPVVNDWNVLAHMGLNIVARDLLEQTAVIRHNPELTAAAAISLAGEGRGKRLAGAARRGGTRGI
jgi:2-phospho-L-lactate transferase/gluconeogenesis factor (CofD/UPF0052 family)